MRTSATWRYSVLLGAAAVSVAVTVFLEPVPQWLEYHDFADTRTILGVPNALDVLSNLPFAVVGLVGIWLAWRRRASMRGWERWPWATLFVGVALTAPGSGWYHLAPDNARLVWDRMPMTVGFMGLLTVVLAERVSMPVARRLFPWLLLLGIASVLYWDWTERAGAGDLRLYGLVQFGSLLMVLLAVLLFPARSPGTGWLWGGMAGYAMAKVLEAADARIFSLGEVVSGHSLKHLAAGAGAACLLAMYLARTSPSSTEDAAVGGR